MGGMTRRIDFILGSGAMVATAAPPTNLANAPTPTSASARRSAAQPRVKGVKPPGTSTIPAAAPKGPPPAD